MAVEDDMDVQASACIQHTCAFKNNVISCPICWRLERLDLSELLDLDLAQFKFTTTNGLDLDLSKFTTTNGLI